MDIKNQQRNFFLQSFANRLCTTLKEKGFASNTASSGVRVGTLSQAADCSNQMARRYTLGHAMPDYNTILKIASWLDVSPGWLLFGSDERNVPQNNPNTELVGIDYQLLRYILTETAPLLANTKNTNEIVDFIMDIIYDATHLATNDKTIKKIIDMAISSANRFQKPVSRKKEREFLGATEKTPSSA